MVKPTSLKLTKSFIAGIIPTHRPVDYSDSTLTGFLDRSHPIGKVVFYYRYRINGSGKLLSLGTTVQLSVS